MGYKIKPMRMKDIGEAVALWKISEGIGLSESDSEAAIRLYLKRNSGLSLVARDGEGKLAGAVLCGHDGRRGCMYHLAIAKEHRRQGLGIGLVEKCIERLARLGITRCNIFVYAKNKEGRKFWQRHGWKARVEMLMMQRGTG